MSGGKKRPGAGLPGRSRGNKGTEVSGLISDINDLDFEDPFGDEFEEEEPAEGLDPNDEDEVVDDDDVGNQKSKDDSSDPKRAWIPGVDELAKGEELEYDPAAYVMYHSLRTEWPCLSFDVMRDNLGDGRVRFPMNMYIVCGSQADRSDKNQLTVLKMSDMHRIASKTSEDSDNDDQEGDDNHDAVLVFP